MRQTIEIATGKPSWDAEGKPITAKTTLVNAEVFGPLGVYPSRNGVGFTVGHVATGWRIMGGLLEREALAMAQLLTHEDWSDVSKPACERLRVVVDAAWKVAIHP